MTIKNFCIVVLGENEGVKDILKKISETNPRCLQQKNILISTFSCVLEASELKELFDEDKRTFFIFEVGKDTSAYKLGREDIHEQLFGYIGSDNNEILKTMSDELINEVNEGWTKMSGETSQQILDTPVEFDIDELTKEEVGNKINELLDKGLKNLNVKEKDLLELLTKKM